MTAQEARKLAGVNEAQENVELALKQIEVAAKDKKREVYLHSDFWVNGGYSRTPEYADATKMLEDLGYIVKFFYEERQFVNMYTVVRW
jgi:hypothetical protein